MDVGTNIKPLLQGRHEAVGLHRPFVTSDVSAHHEIFKKTPFAAGLHSVGRDAVKDIPDIVSIPLLTTTMLDQDVPQGSADAGRMIAENPKAVTRHSHQDVSRSADEFAAVGAVVGLKGNHVIDALFTVTSFHAPISNGKLTDRRSDARTSNGAGCATNGGTGLHNIFARQTRFAIAGASFSGGDLENHSHADV